MPVFPTTITVDGSVEAPDSAILGPFEVAGILYTFPTRILAIGVPPFSTNALNCYKSIDGGETWTQVGGDSDSIGNNPSSYCCVLVGSKVYAVTTSGNFGTNKFLQVIVFDIVTEVFSPAVITTNEYKSSNGGFAEIAAAYRVTDGQLIISAMFSNSGGVPSETRTAYFLFDVLAGTWGAWIPNGFIGVSTDDWGVSFVLRGNGMMHFIFYNIQQNEVWQQALSDADVLGTFQLVKTLPAPGLTTPLGASIETNTIVLSAMVSDSQNIELFTGVSADPIVFVETDLTFTDGSGFINDTPNVVRSGGITYILLFDTAGAFYYSQDAGAFVLLDNTNIYVLRPFVGILSTYVWGAVLLGSLFFFALAGVVPVVTTPEKVTTGGGTYFPRFINRTLLHAQIARVVGPVNGIHVFRDFPPLSWLYDFPNEFDRCLTREWRLYNEIDPQALACPHRPDCFCGDADIKPWVEAPAGAYTFNPDKAIPLPATAAVNVTVLSFRVPIGFDGILLAHYHAYRGGGTFVEGSGDIIWRVRANGRYLRDMGDMELSIGSPQTLSPVPGGLWLHSGNLVEYVVSAPNGSGSLPLPGEGNILAGLHGWFYPRI
jgi:hypothetical protein